MGFIPYPVPENLMRLIFLLTALLLSSMLQSQTPELDTDARQLVRNAMDHWRGITSTGVMTMTIHRPDWERSMTIRSWSKGDDHSLVRVTEPKKDAGNGTLVDGNNMWTFTPKINRIIKVPSSMMGQSWMGSDFSNKDISKTTDIIEQYEHTLSNTETVDGHTIYTITSVPHEEAAVVWGKEVLFIRDDYVLLEQQFWDQDDVLVKSMKATEVEVMGGRPVAKIMRMQNVDTREKWTELHTHEIEFDLELPANLFTLSNLRNPRL